MYKIPILGKKQKFESNNIYIKRITPDIYLKDL